MSEKKSYTIIIDAEFGSDFQRRFFEESLSSSVLAVTNTIKEAHLENNITTVVLKGFDEETRNKVSKWMPTTAGTRGSDL